MAKTNSTPQNMMGVLKQSIALYKLSFSKTLPALMLLTLLAVAPSLFQKFLNASLMGHLSATSILYYIVNTLIKIALMVWLFMAYQQILKKGKLQNNKTVARLKQIYIPCVIATLIISIVSFVGYALMVIPSIMIGVYSLMTLPILALEDKVTPVSAFQKSFSLVRGSFWQTAVVLVIASFLSVLVFYRLFEGHSWLEISLGSLAFLFVLPLVPCALFSQYQNLKLNKPLGKAYKTLMENRPKNFSIAIAAMVIYALVLFISNLMTHLDLLSNLMAQDPKTQALALRQILAPGVLLMLPAIFMAYAYFGSKISQWLLVLVSGLSMVLFLYSIVHGFKSGINIKMILPVIYIILNAVIFNTAYKARHWCEKASDLVMLHRAKQLKKKL